MAKITQCYIIVAALLLALFTMPVPHSELPMFSAKALAYYGAGRRVARRTARRTARRVARRHSYMRPSAPGRYGPPVAGALVIGATVVSLPPSCSSLVVNGVTYYNCNGTFYQPVYDGPNLVYVVVEPPH